MTEKADRTLDEGLGFAPGTVQLIAAVEAVAGRVGLAQKQQVLAAALWRATTGHPSFQMTVDFDVERIVLERGGRDIRAEVRMFPPALAPVEHVEHVEPKVTWRGSITDLVTDLLGVLGPDRLHDLANVAMARAEQETMKAHAAEKGGSNG